MKIILFLLALFLALSSCAPSYKTISISQNESATITRSISYDDYSDEDSIIDFELFPIIKHIENLDSLGYYLQVSQRDCFDFNYDSTLFELKVREDLPLHPSFYYAIPDILTFEFPRKIIEISGRGKVELHRDNKKLVIHRIKDNYKWSDEKVDIKVKFGHDSIPSTVKHPFSFKRTGGSMDMTPGFGYNLITGQASNFMKGSLFVNYGFTVILERLRITPRLASMEAELTKPIIGLEEYSNFSNNNFELGIGYELINSTYFNFSPIVHGGRNKLRFSSDDESIDNKKINGGFVYSIGATLDLKISPFFRKKEKRTELKDQHYYLKIDGGWYPDYFQKTLEMDGSVNYLTLAIGIYGAGENSFRKVKW